MMLSSGLVIIYVRIDQIMLGELTGMASVGVYAAAIRFSDIWAFVPAMINSVIFPSLVRIRQQDYPLYHKRLQDLFDLLALAAWGLGITFTLLARPLILGLLGEDYGASVGILMVHIWAQLFVFLGTARTNWLVAENRTHINLWSTFCGAVINVALNFWLIPLYAGFGAAIATLISYAIAGYFCTFCFPSARPLGGMLTKAIAMPLRLGTVPKLTQRYLGNKY